VTKRTMYEMATQIFEITDAHEGISKSALQRKLGTNPTSVDRWLETIRFIQSQPRLIIKEGKVRLGEDWMDPLIREVLGYEPSPRHLLYMRLLEKDAVSPETAVSLSELIPEEIQIVAEAKEMEHLIVTKDLKVYLSPLGVTLAKGAKKSYTEP